uniref:Junctional adhesion molecule 2a n=1 Tax=Oryzias latipes TaxID=8090 RepID=A0A3B3HUB4_ORYLA
MNHRRVGNKCEERRRGSGSGSGPRREDEMMGGASLCLPIVVLLMQCSPSAPVTVTTDKPKVEVEEFKDAKLSCIFQTERDPDPRIEWKKKGKDVSFVYFRNQFRGPFEGRANITGATVTLHRVTQKDAGEYRCEITASRDDVKLGETNVTLKVLVPPQNPSCEIPSSAVTGSAVKLRCRDQQSIPPATYYWFKDDLLIRPPGHSNASYLINAQTGELEFKSVSREDSGLYSCQASNGVGSPKMCEAKRMIVEDVNVAGVVTGVVVVCLIMAVCGCGCIVLRRNGFFTQGHRGRSNGNYIPPPQEVRASSASLLAQIQWLVWERAESGRVSVPRRTSNTRSRSCSEKLAFFQKIHAMRCQHWIQIFLLSPLVLVSSTKLLSSSTFFKWYSAPPWWSNHELFLLFSIF